MVSEKVPAFFLFFKIFYKILFSTKNSSFLFIHLGKYLLLWYTFKDINQKQNLF